MSGVQRLFNRRHRSHLLPFQTHFVLAWIHVAQAVLLAGISQPNSLTVARIQVALEDAMTLWSGKSGSVILPQFSENKRISWPSKSYSFEYCRSSFHLENCERRSGLLAEILSDANSFTFSGCLHEVVLGWAGCMIQISILMNCDTDATGVQHTFSANVVTQTRNILSSK